MIDLHLGPRDNTIPGTNTKDNEILQARRYLGHLRNPATSSPFSIEAIRELERVFHKKPEVRAANLANNMSNAGKELLRAFESERDNARALGSSADWWSDGLEKKGISTADQQAFAVSDSHRLPTVFHHYPMAWHPHGLAWLLTQPWSDYQWPMTPRLPYNGMVVDFHVAFNFEGLKPFRCLGQGAPCGEQSLEGTWESRRARPSIRVMH